MQVVFILSNTVAQPLDIKALTVVFIARRSLDAIYSFLNVIYLVPIWIFFDLPVFHPTIM